MYRKAILPTKIWTDKKFKCLDEKQKYLFLYLITCPHLNYFGYIHLPIEYIACDVTWEEKDVVKHLNILTKRKMVMYDFETNILFVCNHLLYEEKKSQNDIKRMSKILSDLPESYLAFYLVEKIKEIFPVKDFDLYSFFSSLSFIKKGVSLYEQKETHQKETPLFLVAEEPKEKPVSKKTKEIKESENDASFDSFWKEYPRKTAKNQARKNFQNILKKKKATVEQLITAAKNYNILCVKERREERYIKLPSSFLGRDETYLDYIDEQGESTVMGQESNAGTFEAPINADNFFEMNGVGNYAI